MCLSTVYRNEKEPDSMVMNNVATIECQGENVILTDLLERKMSIRGTLVLADLVNSYCIVKEAE